MEQKNIDEKQRIDEKQKTQRGFSKDLNQIMQFPKKGIFSIVLAKTEKQDSTLMCLSSGTEIDDHTSAKEGSVFVIKGKGTFALEGNEIEMNPGTFIYMPAGALHSLKAEEDLAILLLLTR